MNKPQNTTAEAATTFPEFAHQIAMYNRAGETAEALASGEDSRPLWRTAIHESAHCAVRLSFGMRVARVEIRADGSGCCYPTYPPEFDSGQSDNETVGSIGKVLALGGDPPLDLERVDEDLFQLLRTEWQAVRALAERLLAGLEDGRDSFWLEAEEILTIWELHKAEKGE